MYLIPKCYEMNTLKLKHETKTCLPSVEMPRGKLICLVFIGLCDGAIPAPHNSPALCSPAVAQHFNLQQNYGTVSAPKNWRHHNQKERDATW